MNKFRVTFKFKSWEYDRTIYATDKDDAIRRARLLARPSYRVLKVERVTEIQRNAVKC